jgi:DNA-binding transcriptional regulator YiaG
MVTAKQIRITRERMGETRGKFAKRFGVSRPTLYNWEDDNIGPPKIWYAQQHIEKVLASAGIEFGKRQRRAAQ